MFNREKESDLTVAQAVEQAERQKMCGRKRHNTSEENLTLRNKEQLKSVVPEYFNEFVNNLVNGAKTSGLAYADLDFNEIMLYVRRNCAFLSQKYVGDVVSLVESEYENLKSEMPENAEITTNGFIRFIFPENYEQLVNLEDIKALRAQSLKSESDKLFANSVTAKLNHFVKTECLTGFNQIVIKADKLLMDENLNNTFNSLYLFKSGDNAMFRVALRHHAFAIVQRTMQAFADSADSSLNVYYNKDSQDLIINFD